MNTTLYPYQQKAVEFHLKHHYSLNLSEMGLGKTLVALTIANIAGGEFLILCPAFLQENWKREIRKHLGKANYKILPYSSLSKGVLESISPTTIIADEIHYLKNYKAKRTKNAFKLLKRLEPKYFIGLTGTPIQNRIPEFYTALSMVSMNPSATSGIDVNRYFESYFDFADRYCDATPNIYSGGNDYHGFKPERMVEFQSLLKRKVFKVQAKDVLDLPPLTHKRVVGKLKQTPGLIEAFASLAHGHGGVDSTAKKESAISKVDFTIEYVKNMLGQGCGPVVIYSDHVEPAERLAEEFKTEAITGKTPMKRRNEIHGRFERGGGVLVATIGAFSVGVNLTNSSNLVFNDISWVPGSNSQALKRIHRIGATRHCTVHYMLSGVVDEKILDKLQKKAEVIEKTNALAVGLTNEVCNG